MVMTHKFIRKGSLAMPSNKENFVSIYLSPEDYEKIEELKARRRGRGASKTAVVRDIVHYFFGLSDAQQQQALHMRGNNSHS